MSQTILVKQICEMFGNYQSPTGFSQKKEVIEKAVDKVFNFDYPIYDENYRNVLNKKILNHFYMSEIGQETIALWQHYLETTLNEIMPYYNKLYETELLKFNPLIDIDLEKTYTRGIDETKNTNTNFDSVTDYIRNLQSKTNATNNNTSDSTVSATTSANSTNETDKDDWNLYLDTPQGGIENLYAGNENSSTGKYLTDARHQYGKETDISNSTGQNDTVSSLTNNETSNSNVNETGTTNTSVSNESNSNENSNQNEQYIESLKGKQAGASYSKMLLEFRDTLLNIDSLILKELEPLFYGLW